MLKIGPSAVLGLFFLVLPAHAGPDIYVDTVRVFTSQQECLDDFKADLLKAGFEDDSIYPTTYTDNSGKEVHDGWRADSSQDNISVAVECESRDGMGSFAISGTNRDSTYAAYKKIFDIIVD